LGVPVLPPNLNNVPLVPNPPPPPLVIPNNVIIINPPLNNLLRARIGHLNPVNIPAPPQFVPQNQLNIPPPPQYGQQLPPPPLPPLPDLPTLEELDPNDPVNFSTESEPESESEEKKEEPEEITTQLKFESKTPTTPRRQSFIERLSPKATTQYNQLELISADPKWQSLRRDEKIDILFEIYDYEIMTSPMKNLGSSIKESSLRKKYNLSSRYFKYAQHPEFDRPEKIKLEQSPEKITIVEEDKTLPKRLAKTKGEDLLKKQAFQNMPKIQRDTILWEIYDVEIASISLGLAYSKGKSHLRLKYALTQKDLGYGKEPKSRRPEVQKKGLVSKLSLGFFK